MTHHLQTQRQLQGFNNLSQQGNSLQQQQKPNDGPGHQTLHPRNSKHSGGSRQRTGFAPNARDALRERGEKLLNGRLDLPLDDIRALHADAKAMFDKAPSAAVKQVWAEKADAYAGHINDRCPELNETVKLEKSTVASLIATSDCLAASPEATPQQQAVFRKNSEMLRDTLKALHCTDPSLSIEDRQERLATLMIGQLYMSAEWLSGLPEDVLGPELSTLFAEQSKLLYAMLMKRQAADDKNDSTGKKD
jgi:hypothetical protein